MEGGGGTCFLVSLKYFSISLVLQNQTLKFLCSLVPKITFVSLFPTFFDLWYPVPLKINESIPLFPVTPETASLYCCMAPEYGQLIYNKKKKSNVRYKKEFKSGLLHSAL